MDAFERRLRRLERGGARELVAIVRRARSELRRRLLSLPAGASEAEVITQMLRALDDAAERLRLEAGRSIVARARRGMRLGIAAAEAQIPALAGSPVLFNVNAALLESVLLTDAALIRVGRDLREKIAGRLQVAILAGTPMRDVARGIEEDGINPLGPFKTAAHRARTIAVTEINRAYNLGTWNRYQDAGTRIAGLEKEWVTAEDGRVRESHAALHGTRVPINEAFSVGGHRAMHPLDTNLPVGESVNCRCRVIAIVPEESN